MVGEPLPVRAPAVSKQLLLINFLAFQVGWFACVMGAANGMPSLGPIVVLGVIALHLSFAIESKPEIRLMICAALIGVVYDSLLVYAGLVSYSNGTLIAGTAPYWIVTLWVLFATTLNVSLRWLRGNMLLAGVLGAIAGPLSYLAGSKLGAVEFAQPAYAVVALAAGWAMFMPMLIQLADRFDGFQLPARQPA